MKEKKSEGFKPVSPKVDFPALERELLKKWYELGIVKKYLTKNKSSKKKFSFLDGPITANNPMGVHHAWGRTYKDLWQRFWNMRGATERFQNGFDEQGLWVEVEVEKELDLKNKRDIENLVEGDTFKSLEKFINLCKERVKKFSSIQTEQSKRLGYFMDWENSYHTSSDENNYAIWNFLKVVHKKGWLYKGRDSVPWCPRCGTAISQHEILTEEYKELTHKTVVFKLPITTKGWENASLLVWTTTPWTVPGNVAVAVDPDLTYWQMKNENGEHVILINPEGSKEIPKQEMLVNKFSLIDGLSKIKELKGSDLVGLEYDGPYDGLPAVKKALGSHKHRVIATDPQILPISPAEGTGMVHIAPGAGAEDYKLGKKEQLPVIEEIDEAGVFLGGFDFVSSEHVKKAMPLILEDLEKRNLAFKITDYTHRYPTCWRCKTELVWRVVDEWYIAMDKKDPSTGSGQGKTYREQMVEVAKKIHWLPDWGLDRELDWLKNMHDWLISKKRYWGLALPIWECRKCGKITVVGGKEELKEKAKEGWDEFEGNSPHRPWIDQVVIKCDCGESISRIPDVGNPWLDAGIVPFSTMSSDWFPADFITESFPGQFKNWFYSLIAMATALKNENPFKTVLGFATMVDEKGEAFHKSKGNAIEFVEGADKAGADVIRWSCVTANPEQNVLFGYHIADEVRRRFHLLLWNVYNFFVTYANIDGWRSEENRHSGDEHERRLQNPDPGSHSLRSVQAARMTKSRNVLDEWILSRLNQTTTDVTKYLENYSSRDASLNIESFVNDLSLWYIRRSRDRVGPSSRSIEDRNNFYETSYYVLVTLSQLLAPFIPFIAEEIYTNLTGEESVHLSDWPSTESLPIDENIIEDMRVIRSVVERGHATRKANNIKVRQPLATVLFSGKERVEKDRWNRYEFLLISELNVKAVEYGLYKDISKNKSLVEFTEGMLIDLEITPALKAEGEARDIVRKIQEERKKLGTKLNEKVNVVLDYWPKEFEEEIKRKALVQSLTQGTEFKVLRA